MKTIKNAILASTVAMCGSGVHAEQSTPTLDWSGTYYGAAIGYADTGSTFDNGFLFTPTFDVSGRVGSLFVGYNWQNDKTVYGFEADITSSDISGNYSPLPCGAVPGCVTKISSMMSLRGRIGYAVGNALYYSSFGIVVADLDSELTGFPAVSSNRTSPLFAVGGEWAMGQGWNMRAEYSTMDFGNEPEPVVGGGTLNVGIDRIDLLRVGFSRKF